VNQFLNTVWSQEPFHEYRNYFNVRRIDVASAQSGVDHPERTPPVFKDTAFDAAYNCAGTQRLVCVNTTKVLNAVAILPPSQRDLIVVIVNDTEYGGSGGSVAVSSINIAAAEIVLHEVGHTLAFLADEYTSQPPTCSDASEPDEPNATKETNRDLIKWRAWIDPSTPVPTTTTAPGVPGLYLGSMYCPTTLYRPTFDSKMRTLGRPFDQINTEQFVKRFYEFATPIDSYEPVSTTLSLRQGQLQEFTVTTPQPQTHALGVAWRVDGILSGSGTTFTLNTASLVVGNHTVAVTVTDSTLMVRNDPGSLLVQQSTWNLTVSPPLQFSLTTVVSTVGGGTIQINPPSPNGFYIEGTSVELTAIASPGYAFSVWSGDLTGTMKRQSIVMSASKSVTADFTSTNQITASQILWRHLQTGDVAIWRMNGATLLEGGVISTVSDLGWQIAGIGDVDGSPTTDIIWRHNQTGAVAVWLMDGYAIRQAGIVSNVSDLHWQIAGIGDLDNDNKADIVWRNDQTGDVAGWLMDGLNLRQGGIVSNVPDLDWQIAGIGDLTGEGSVDILWRHSQSGAVAAWLMDGLHLLQGGVIAVVPDQDWQIAAVGDFDVDLRSDLAWRHRQTGDVAVWLLDGLTVFEGNVVQRVADQNWQIQ
jgi:hypothetical protein